MSKKEIIISEGMIKKGNTNMAPVQSRPAPPKGQSSGGGTASGGGNPPPSKT